MILAVQIPIAWIIVAFFLAGFWIALLTLGTIFENWREERRRLKQRKARPGYLFERSRLR